MSTNEILQRGFKNPKCVAAIELMQINPQEAKKRFANDEEVNIFMKEFGKLMSNHFTNLGSSNKPVVEENQKLAKDIQEIGPLHAQVLKQKDSIINDTSSNVETEKVNEVRKERNDILSFAKSRFSLPPFLGPKLSPL